MKTHLLILVLVILSFNSIKAQDTIHLSLQQAIEQSDFSVDALVAKNAFRASYWEYRTYRAELLPEVLFDGTLPSYSKTFHARQDDKGVYSFIRNDLSQYDASLSINQNIPLTGGKLAVETSLQRLDQFGDNRSTSYMSIPIQFRLDQPIGGFNRVKWLSKIEPVKYEEAKAILIAELEDIHLRTIILYFNLLLAKSNLEIAKQNYSNTTKLYSIAEARRAIGQLSDNDLLQLRVSMLNAESYLSDAQSDLSSSMFQIRSFLGYNDQVVVSPILPEPLCEQVELSYVEVQKFAMKNSPFTHSIAKRQLEASRDVSKAKADRWTVNLYASYGMSGKDPHFRYVYDDLRPNQVAVVGIQIPLVDWGKRKGKVKVAESNRELTYSRAEKEQQEFNQNLFLQVENFNRQFKQLAIAKETDEISQTRYNTSVETFILGKIDILNLTDAQSSKDFARRKYIIETQNLWRYYYQIRGITLYDFLGNSKIDFNHKTLVD